MSMWNEPTTDIFLQEVKCFQDFYTRISHLNILHLYGYPPPPHQMIHIMYMGIVVVVGMGRDRMVVGFTTTCEFSAYHH